MFRPDSHCSPKLIFKYSGRVEVFSQNDKNHKYCGCSAAAKILKVTPPLSEN